MEVLSHYICRAMEKKEWKSVRITNRDPRLSHIFFVDDLLLSGEASFSQARMMKYILG